MNRRFAGPVLAALAVAAALGGLYVSRHAWGPPASRWLAAQSTVAGDGQEPHQHEADTSEHHEDDAGARIELSAQAQQNIGLKTAVLQPQTFTRTITVPGIVIKKPARTEADVTAPVAGVVTRFYPVRGETVEPGSTLFRLRITHEEIVQAQADLLRTTEELDVIAQEIARLEKISEGVIPGKTLLEKKYERQKLEVTQHAQTQALVLHGLTEEQVRAIVRERRLRKEVTVHAPVEGADSDHVQLALPAGSHELDRPATQGKAELPRAAADPTSEAANVAASHSDVGPRLPRRYLEVEGLFVQEGEHVAVGQRLCRLADYSFLEIDGVAFERDLQLVSRAFNQGWNAAASVESGSGQAEILPELRVLYLSNSVDPDSRAFHFYVDLPNEIVRDARTKEGHRFISWRFKPGQRVQVLVPVEQWPDRLVVPAGAVVQDGAETYVFQRNGDLFERRAVHLEYQDQRWAVVANDGSVFPEEAIVVTGAYQLHLAIKNRGAGGIDPHAGHQH